MRHFRFAIGLLAAYAIGAGATPLTVTDPFINLEALAVNSIGIQTGDFIRVGATSVTPNGSNGTTGTFSVTEFNGNRLTGGISYTPSPKLPDFFSAYGNLATYTALVPLTNPVTMTFRNGSDSVQVVKTLPGGAGILPFVDSITITGSALNPTFSWTPPAGTIVNGYRVNIIDKTLINHNPNAGPINTGQVTSINLQPNVTSYTVNAGDFIVPGYAFTTGRNYSIEISLIQTNDGTSTNLRNDNLKSISRVYADFTPTNGAGGPAVNLPVALVSGAFQFNISVLAGQTYYIDPLVATGYDYAIGAGDPSFASVLLPTGIGDDLYDIWGLDGAGNPILLAHDWLAGQEFDFAQGGLNRFRVTGIEPGAGLDPTNPMAFVTGLTFAGDGKFTGTQTPITTNIPEPASLVLVALGLVGLSFARRKVTSKRRQLTSV